MKTVNRNETSVNEKGWSLFKAFSAEVLMY